MNSGNLELFYIYIWFGLTCVLPSNIPFCLLVGLLKEKTQFLTETKLQNVHILICVCASVLLIYLLL